jgi:glycosyltransferase involved in cell wall biosynthesis
MIAELGLTDRVRHAGRASDGALSRLYQSSVALVYPSLYEGFGIPPLEAMACGTAVIAANVASIPEVVGDAALLFDPYSTEDLAAQLTRILDSASLRDRLVHLGHQRVQMFTWAQTIDQTWKAYSDLVGRCPNQC